MKKTKSKKDKIKGISFGVLLAGKVHDGSKTVTRRVVASEFPDLDAKDWAFMGIDLHKDFRNQGEFRRGPKVGDNFVSQSIFIPCPYQVGQLLYVREPWRVDAIYDKPSGSGHIPDDGEIAYMSDNGGTRHEFGGRRRIARFMPKRFARTFVKITGVRCERLLAIDHKDAVREGIDHEVTGGRNYYRIYSKKPTPRGVYPFSESPQKSFLSLWDAVNGKDAHLQNPWVWVIEFEKVEMPNPWNLSLPWKPTWTKCDGEWLYGNRDHVLGCDFAMNVEFDGFMLWDWSVSIGGTCTDSGFTGGGEDVAKENAIKAYRKSSKGIMPHLL